eukprot:TRINITY_DN1057_c0_g1_i1.p1 TRINITY_DN1057_c0_g1~~TRINITY_DN1057_c0_g1_i1.p1  ORF type:complete len:391 (-),score=102.15 TRINITY_DN1057_c0_g1_i1:89-1261(-)
MTIVSEEVSNPPKLQTAEDILSQPAEKSPSPASEESAKMKEKVSEPSSPINFIDRLKGHFHFLVHLFFTRKFILHRQIGLLYLILFAVSFIMFFVDYERFKTSPIVLALPVTGFLQSLTAAITFTFLPKSTDPGYYGDKGVLSYRFVVENSFFSLILMFQWLYYHDAIYPVIRKLPIMENCFVFLPYLFRILWPKTRFRDSLDRKNNKSEKNYLFFFVATWITKIFYVWAKHYIGLFLNYDRFLDRVTDDEKYHIHFTFMAGTFSTTIAMFLHTLKFKRYMDPVLSFVIYMAGYMMTFWGFIASYHIFVKNFDLFLATLIGVGMNFTGNWQHVYQVLLMIVLNYQRANDIQTIPEAVTELASKLSSIDIYAASPAMIGAYFSHSFGKLLY